MSLAGEDRDPGARPEWPLTWTKNSSLYLTQASEKPLPVFSQPLACCSPVSIHIFAAQSPCSLSAGMDLPDRISLISSTLYEHWPLGSTQEGLAEPEIAKSYLDHGLSVLAQVLSQDRRTEERWVEAQPIGGKLHSLGDHSLAIPTLS